MSKNLICLAKLLFAASFGILLLLPAAAADYAPPPSMGLSTSEWSGLHVGGFLEAACLDTVYVPPGTDPELAGCAAGGGLLAGYDFAFDNVVVGIEGDYGWSGRIASNTLDNVVYDFDTMASLRGRLGYAIDDTLIYATGGIGWINATLKETALDESASQWHVGWLAGGGIEHQLNQNLALRLEYLYGHYGEETYTITCGCTIEGGLDNVHTMRAALTWKFAWGEEWVSTYGLK